jgi:Uma2 family endonuclease
MTELFPQAVALDDEIYYPETDGEPMAETDFQRNPLIYAVKALDIHFAQHPDVYVSGNLLIYYIEGNPYKSIAPDVFVVFGIPKYERPIYQTWVEGKGPDVVIEITSKTTRKRDEEEKPPIYRAMGVQEYFQYDPQGEYLTPALQGRRLDAAGNYTPIPAKHQNGRGSVLVLPSQVLDLELHLEEKRLRLYNPATSSYLLSHEEAEQARMLAETQVKAEAEARRLIEEQFKSEAEARSLAEAKYQAEMETRLHESEARLREAEARRLVEEQLKTVDEARRLVEEQFKAEAEARSREAESRRQAEERFKAEAEARMRAEEAQRQAEAKYKAAEEAQRQAEERIKALEAELQRLRQQDT